MSTIMLCLNQLGIGGVETAVLNQAIELIRRNFKVVVLAKDGIYKERFEKEGVVFFEVDFKVEDKYDYSKIEKVISIIKEYNVEQVHIHQFDCINIIFPACVLTKIPYIAYAHTGILGTYNWFEECFKSYQTNFKLFFETAIKIIAITEQSKNEIIKRYSIDSNKILVINNSIDFKDFVFEHNSIPSKIDNFLIISRLAKEKLISISNAILVFKQYLLFNPNAKLTIVGDGNYREEIENQIKDISYAVNMLGKKSNISEIISKNDVVIGLDRCVLEAIAMKKIAIISGYENIKCIVTPDIIHELAKFNFSGVSIESKEVDTIIQDLKEMTSEKIKKIVCENYDYAFSNLNINKNLFVIKNVDKVKSNLDSIYAMKALIKLQNILYENIEYTNKVYKDCKEAQAWLEGIIKNKDNEIELRDKSINELKLRIQELTEKEENLIKRLIKRIINNIKKRSNKA